MITRRAFTIIELLVVLGISAFLSALAITYSNAGRNAIALSVEASKISQAVLQAKALSIATYTAAPAASCGYGVIFNLTASPQTYSIFSYSPVASPAPCPTLASTTDHLAAANGDTGLLSSEIQKYTAGTWQVPVSKGVVVETSQGGTPIPDSLGAVVFYPPDPTVLLSHDGTIFPDPPATQRIYLATADGKNSLTISVNPEGQVSF